MKRQFALIALILALAGVALFGSRATGAPATDPSANHPEQSAPARQGGKPAKQFEPDGGEWFYVFLLALGAVFMVALIVLGLSRRDRP